MVRMPKAPPFLISPLLHPICHGFFTRIGGVSRDLFKSLNIGNNKGDLSQNINENRNKICRALNRKPNSLVCGIQKHTTNVIYVDKVFNDQIPIADALVTNVKGLVLGVQTADCVPVIIADSKAKIVSVIHAGWKGATSGILENTVQLMREIGTNHNSNLLAAIGPCIWQRSYEVGPEFREIIHDHPQFLLKHDSHTGHFWFDLPGYVKNILHNLGIERVSPSPYDTFTEELMFFSYRRATLRKEPNFGLQLSCVSL